MSTLQPDVPDLPPLPSQVRAGQVPTWDAGNLKHRACPVCGKDTPAAMCRRPDRLLVGQCPECAMIYLPNVPDTRDLEEFYRRYGSYKGLAPTNRSRFERRRAAKYDPHLQLLVDTGGLRGRRLCELGCSFGGFLRLAKQAGAEVFGVDLDAAALSRLAQCGIPSAPGLKANQLFDVVCAFQFLEHLTDPGECIARVASTLVDDGRLLLALPNGGEAAKVGPMWIGFRVDFEHLNYFALDTLSRLLSKHGLYVEQFWEHRQPGVAREGDEKLAQAVIGARLWRKCRQVLSGPPAAPRGDQGTFVLTVLARKCHT